MELFINSAKVWYWIYLSKYFIKNLLNLIKSNIIATFVDIKNLTIMKIGEKVKKVREAKGLSQKQVALSINMDQSQYSKVEKGKTDPTCSTLEKISKALGMELSELFRSNDIFKDINSYDKSLMEKINLLEQLDEPEKKSIFNIIDGLISKKKLKDSLSSALNMAG